MKRIKGIFLTLTVILLCFSAFGCTGCTDASYFKKTLVIGSKWEAADFGFWFKVEDIHNGETGNGEIVLADGVRSISFDRWTVTNLGVSTTLNIYYNVNPNEPNDGAPLISGQLKEYGEDWFTLKIDENNIPDNTATEITFRRVME